MYRQTCRNNNYTEWDENGRKVILGSGSSFAWQRLLRVVKLSHSNTALHFLAQTATTGGIEFRSKFQSAGTLDSLDGDFEIRQRLAVRDASVGEHEGSEGDFVAWIGSVFGEDDFVEMSRHGDVRWLANHFVRHSVFAIGLLAGKIQRSCDDANGGVFFGQVAAEVFKVRPVIPVKALSDLGAHVAQGKCRIHRILAPFGVRGRNLVATVVARAEIVGQLAAEHGWDGCVFNESTVLAVAVPQRDRVRSDVLSDPGRVPGSSVVGSDQGERVQGIADGARESILEQTRGIDWRRTGSLGR
jgi:hypothetical protein